MKYFLRDLSIKQKLILITILVTGLVVFLTELVSIIKEVIDFRSYLINSLTSQAEIIEMNSTAALIFKDQKSAEETLSALKTAPHIIRANIYSEDGKLFAKYKRHDVKEEFSPLLSMKDGYSFGINKLSVFHNIIFDNKPIGMLYIESDLKEFYSIIKWHAGFAVVVLICALSLAFLLLTRLQKVITDPITNLLRVMDVVSKNKNYSVRAPVESHDEMGFLSESFNEMLSKIQEHEEKIRSYSENLELMVQERTAKLIQTTEMLKKELTERKQIEDALRESENKFRDLSEKSLAGIYLIQDGGYKYVNPRLAEMFGYTVDEIIGKKTQKELTFKEDWDFIEKSLRDLLYSDMKESHHNFRGVKKTGEIIYLESYGSRTIYNDQPAVIGTLVDVTARKRAEEAFKTEKKFIESVINILPGTFYMFDEDGYFLKWNKNVEKITGYSPEELKKMKPLDFFEDAEKGLIEEKIKEIFEKGEAFVEANVVTKSGEKIPFFFSAIHFRTGDYNCFVGTGIDIRERKHAEEELRKLNLELEKRVAKRTAQLEATNRELEAFSYSVSHDLRAPLRAIDGFSSIVLEDYANKIDDDGKHLLTVIKDNIKKIEKLINALLTLSRIGRKNIELMEIDMSKLAQEVFDEVKILVPERDVQLKVNSLPPASGDPAMIRQVFFNLISNAIKFTKIRDIGIIEVDGREEEEENIYSIKDNGAGFDMQFADKLFGAFQRLHAEKEFEGTGIGLATVQRIIHRHGGRVWAEGQMNEGATFYFTLPKG
ncbi:MAG: PAS domain S-box protein [Thermodesulfovibrionales bacterium]